LGRADKQSTMIDPKRSVHRDPRHRRSGIGNALGAVRRAWSRYEQVLKCIAFRDGGRIVLD
jgi:hypothetical protein